MSGTVGDALAASWMTMSWLVLKVSTEALDSTGSFFPLLLLYVVDETRHQFYVFWFESVSGFLLDRFYGAKHEGSSPPDRGTDSIGSPVGQLLTKPPLIQRCKDKGNWTFFI